MNGAAPAAADASVMETAASHIDGFFAVANLMTERSAIRVFPPDSSASEIASYLGAQNFDIAVVERPGGEPGFLPIESARAAGDRPAHELLLPIGPQMRV